MAWSAAFCRNLRLAGCVLKKPQAAGCVLKKLRVFLQDAVVPPDPGLRSRGGGPRGVTRQPQVRFSVFEPKDSLPGNPFVQRSLSVQMFL